MKRHRFDVIEVRSISIILIFDDLECTSMCVCADDECLIVDPVEVPRVTYQCIESYVIDVLHDEPKLVFPPGLEPGFQPSQGCALSIGR